MEISYLRKPWRNSANPLEAFALLVGVRYEWLPWLRYCFSPGCRMHPTEVKLSYKKNIPRVHSRLQLEEAEDQGSEIIFWIVVCAFEFMLLGFCKKIWNKRVMFWLSKCWSAGKFRWPTFASGSASNINKTLPAPSTIYNGARNANVVFVSLARLVLRLSLGSWPGQLVQLLDLATNFSDRCWETCDLWV